VRGDHEKQATKGERNPGDNPSLGAKRLNLGISAATSQTPANTINKNPTSASLTLVRWVKASIVISDC